MSEFDRVPESAWVLCPTIKAARRERLLHSPAFERIVENLLSKMQVEKVQQQGAPDGQPGHRCIVVLRLESERLDTFFNSASGYRAQYLIEPEVGDRANRFVVDRALPKIVRAIGDRPARVKVVVESSLAHPWSKVWIHQGLWLRRAKHELRVLLVPSWQRELASEDKHRRKLARWGSLAPAHELRLLLKGGYVLSSNELNVGKPPSKRALDIHALGFT